MKKYFNVIFLFFLLMFGTSLKAQCADCDIINPTVTNNYIFPANKKVCFTQDATFQDVSFENNAKICIAPNVSVTFNTNTNTTAGFKNELEIYGVLNYTGSNPNFKSDLKMTIGSSGILNSGSSGITITNSTTSLINNGVMNFSSTLNFASSAANNYFENNGVININRINASKGVNTIYNKGTISLSSTFDNNATTLYINCGTVKASQGLNLGGGKVINTGNLLVDNGISDFSNGSRLENYGTASFFGGINGGGNSSIYNEGLVKMASVNMNGMTLQGPAGSPKKGYFYTKDLLNPNGAKIGPNLDFSRYATFNPDAKSSVQGVNAIFANTPIFISQSGTPTTALLANVTFDCQGSGNCSAPLISTFNICPDRYGNFPTFCVKPGSTNLNVSASKVGISTFLMNDGFPENIPNGQLVLSSKDKGLVITRVQNSNLIIGPIEGMIVYDISAGCVKLYNGTSWNCLQRTCNE